MASFRDLDDEPTNSSDHKHVCKCREEKVIEKWTIEMYKGDSTFHRENRKNKISTAKFSVWNFIVKSIFLNFRRYGNLFFLVISLIQLINPDLSPFYEWISIFPLGFYLVINWTKQVFLDGVRTNEDNKINNIPTRKGRKGKGGLTDEDKITWKDLQVGDIIQLRRDEVCPADVLILDTPLTKNKENVCYVGSERVDGIVGLTMKRSVGLTKLEGTLGKNKFEEFRKKLTGKIEYSAPNDSLTKFSGVLKLKRDPKAETLSIQNLILRGAILKNTDWMFGICLYVGQDTKVMRNTWYTKEKRSYFEKQIQKFFIFSIFLVIMMSVISTIVILAYSSDLTEIIQYEVDATNGLRIFFYFTLYSPTIPISIYGTLDIVTLIQRWRLEQIFCKDTPEAKHIKVLDPNVFPNLGQVEYCFLDKTGTLTTADYNVECLYVNQRVYGPLQTESIGKILGDSYQPLRTLLTINSDVKEDLRNRGAPAENMASENDDIAIENDKITNPSNLKDYQGEYKLKDEIENRMRGTKTPNRDSSHEIASGDIRVQTEDVALLNTDFKITTMSSPKDEPAQNMLTSSKMKSSSNFGHGAFSKKMSTKEKTNGELQTTADENPMNGNKEHADIPEDGFIADYKAHDQGLDELISAFAVCHSTRTRFVGTEYLYETSSPEELALLKFSKSCAKIFEKSNRFDNPKDYLVSDRGEKLHYSILGINDFSYKRRKFSIVIKPAIDLPTSKTTVLVKGPDYSMKNSLSMDEHETDNYDRIVERFHQQGLKTVVLAKKTLDATESKDYHTKYQNLKNSLYGQSEQLEDLAVTAESKLELLGIVGLRDTLRPGSVELIQSLRDSDIKVWMLTGDIQDNAYNVAVSTGMINVRKPLYTINSSQYEETKVMLRNILSQIKKKVDESNGASRFKAVDQTKEQNRARKSLTTSTTLSDSAKDVLNNSLMVSGDAVEVIFDDKYLRTNFSFICSMCSSVLGFKLAPKHKKLMVKMVKDRFQGRPITMAIGDGLNDALMFQTADISLELETYSAEGKKEILPSNAADIKIHNFDVITELLLVHGRNFANKTENVILYVFYKSFVLGLPLFFFNWYSSFTGTAIHDSLFVFLYSFLFTFFPIIIYGGFDKSEPEDVLRALPALYIDGRSAKSRIFKSFAIKAGIESLFHACIAFYLAIYCVNSTYSPKGLNSDFGMMALVATYSVIIITNIKVLWIFKRYTAVCLTLIICSVASLVIYMPINQKAQFVQSDYLLETKKIFDWAPPILTLIYTILCSYGFSYFVKNVIMNKFFPTLFDTHIINEEDFREWQSNSNILSQAREQFDFSGIVKAIFKHPEYMDPIVEEMLNPTDTNLNELQMNKVTLFFTDRVMEKHFKEITAKSTLLYSKIMYMIFLIVFGAYSLAQSISSGDILYGYSRLGVFLGFLLLAVVLLTDFYRQYYEKIILGFIFLAITVKIVFDWVAWVDSSLMSAMVPILTSTFFNVSSFVVFVFNVLHFAIWIARTIVLYTSQIDEFDASPDHTLLNFYTLLGYALLIGGIMYLSNLLGYKFDKDRRNEYSANVKLEVQMSKSSDILSILLPKFVKESIDKAGNKVEENQGQDNVTILFCDILDFDKVIRSEGKKIVNILDYIFRSFDQLCTTHGCQKIETVGKTYMACSGFKKCEVGMAKNILSIEPTKRIINMAFAMLSFIEKVKYGENGAPLKIKIGVHYGSVIAGIIGYHKPQFSLIGDPVNTASRMCSTGKDGKINISEESRQRLKDSDFIFIHHTVHPKGKDPMANYVVEKRMATSEKLGAFKAKALSAIQKGKENGLIGGGRKKEDATVEVVNVSDTQGLKKLGTVAKYQDANWKNIKDLMKTKVGKDQIAVALKSDVDKDDEEAANDPESIRSMNKDLDDDEIVGIDDDEDEIQLRPNKWFLTFSANDKRKAEGFSEDIMAKNKKFFDKVLVLLFAIYLLQTLTLISIRNDVSDDVFILVYRSGFNLLLIFLVIFKSWLSKRGALRIVVFIFFIYGLVTAIIQAYIDNYRPLQNIEQLELMFIYLIGSHFSGITFFWTLLLSIAMAITWFSVCAVKGILSIENVFFFCCFVLANLTHSYIYLKNEIQFYNSFQRREKKKTEQRGLVSQLLPSHCIEKYFDDPSAKLDITDEFENVTILFADIKGFTEYCNRIAKGPDDVVKMLSKLFTRFDKLCIKFSIYKVYTIGDCYVALGFVDSANRDPGREAINMVKMATSMIDIIKEVGREVNFTGLNMRIGLHTGSLIGGIIGTDIVRYDIYGPDVLMANKMESNGVEGNICVSESTKLLLERHRPDFYHFDQHVVVTSASLQISVQSYLVKLRPEDEGP